MTPERMTPELSALPVALVGAGAVGRVMALALHAAGLDVQAVLSRSADGAAAVAREAGAATASRELAALPASVRLVLLCTPDAAIGPVAEQLAARDHPWAETWVGHTSGALSVAPLGPLQSRGARVFGFHPLQTLTRASRPEVLRGAYVGIEYADLEYADLAKSGGIGEALAARLGMEPLALRAEDKARYHLAATLASNGLVALMGAVADVLATLGIQREEAFGVVAPLLRGTLDNLAAGTPESALTGAVARGDAATVARHLDALSGDLAHQRALYLALQHQALRLAVSGEKLDREQEAAVRRALDGLDAQAGQ